MPTLFPAYHVGIVVTDLEESMAEFSETFGVEWHRPFPAPTEIHIDGQPTKSVSPRLTYSKQGPVYLELLEQVPDTTWAEPGLHHLGLWTDNVLDESKRLAESGIPLLQTDLDVSSGAKICYHTTRDGLRLELVDIGRGGPSIASYLSGAADKLIGGRS